MKALIKLIALIGIFNMGAQAQGVLPCLSVNGTPNPGSKNITVCPGTFNLGMINCHASPVPADSTTYGWKNLSSGYFSNPFAASLNNVSRGDSGVWVGYMVNIGVIPNDTVTDTMHVHFYPQPPVLSLQSVPMTSGFSVSDPLVTKCLLSTNTVNLTANSFTSYSWEYTSTANVTSILSTGVSLNLTPSNSYLTGSYTVKGIDNNGCIRNHPFNVISSDPLVTLSPIIQYRCAGETTSLSIRNTSHALNPTTGGGAIFSYTWFIGDPNPNKIISPVSPGGTTNYGGDQIDFLSGGVDNQNGGNYPIDTFNVLGLDTIPNAKIVCRMNSALSCIAYDTVQIITVATPVVSAGLDTTICYGATASLHASIVSGGRPPYSYSWSNGGNTANTTASPTGNTTYSVNVTDGSGCGFAPQSDNVAVFVNPQIIVNAGNDTSICKLPTAGTASLNATGSGGAGGLTYAWLPTTGLSSATISNPTATPVATTTYTVTVTDAINCSNTDNVVVTRYLPSIAGIPYPIVVSEGKPYTIDAATGSNSGFSFEWTDLSVPEVVSTAAAYEVKYKGEDTISYEIEVIDPSNNCLNRDTAIVWFISDNTILFVPNIFSPGAEYTDNQKLKVFADNISPDDYRFIIFNKWGQIVFETTDVEEAREGWDGGPQIEGVYTYVMEGKFKNGKNLTESKNYMGSFKLSK